MNNDTTSVIKLDDVVDKFSKQIDEVYGMIKAVPIRNPHLEFHILGYCTKIEQCYQKNIASISGFPTLDSDNNLAIRLPDWTSDIWHYNRSV